MELAEAQGLWRPAGTYLNTASYGLPPDTAWAELQAALEDWRSGRTSWEHWGESTERARASFARLLGVDEGHVAVGATVAELVGLIAASVPDGTTVLAPEGDFTSVLWPWAVQAPRGVTVRSVPLADLVDALDADVDVVALSAVQSADGQVTDLGLLAAAATEAGALTVVDASQAAGWHPVSGSGLDAVIVHGYKWLLAPRGTTYAYLGDRLRDTLRPLNAGWYAAEDVHSHYYGLPAKLAASARRFDTSPAWFSWVGAAPAIELIERIGVDEINRHDVGLANRFREGLGLDPGDSAIVAATVPDAARRLADAGVQAATRAGSLRVSFHLYNTERDVDRALEALLD